MSVPPSPSGGPRSGLSSPAGRPVPPHAESLDPQELYDSLTTVLEDKETFQKTVECGEEAGETGHFDNSGSIFVWVNFPWDFPIRIHALIHIEAADMPPPVGCFSQCSLWCKRAIGLGLLLLSSTPLQSLRLQRRSK
jgi:hypothetical protein